MKKRLIIGVIIGLIILALTIINELDRVEKIEKNKNTETPSVTTTQTTTTSATTQTTTKTTKVRNTSKKVAKSGKKVANSPSSSETYKVTHYGPDCRGCSGITASGYNVKHTIWYNDPQYGKIRVVATSKKFPLYSIIRLNNYGGDFIAIVLDRGVSGNVIDLLVSSEKEARKLGVKRNVTIDLLRSGK